ncbi:hypothetical protein YA35_05855 [Klebsiella aerogenes]|nr:hypothetical protein YA35_05855 [Klebsiella aerogenes]
MGVGQIPPRIALFYSLGHIIYSCDQLIIIKPVQILNIIMRMRFELRNDDIRAVPFQGIKRIIYGGTLKPFCLHPRRYAPD